MGRIAGFLALALLLVPSPAAAAADGDTICRAAGQVASSRTGVPEAVLRAISLTETGRSKDGRLQAWPWTVNMEGKGKWFDTREEALAYVNAHHSRGARSYDVGCFQINYRWHGNAFSSVEQMFDPEQNALYAAKFLADLYRETGSWPKSAAAYHSRTPKYANRYRARFERILARVTGEPPPPPVPLPQTPPAEVTQHAAAPDAAVVPIPVAVAGPLTISPPSAGRNGSLMPLDALPSSGSLLIQPGRPLF